MLHLAESRAPRRSVWRVVAASTVVLLLAACATAPPSRPTPRPSGRPAASHPAPPSPSPRPAPPAYPQPSLSETGRVTDLPGWAEDDHLAAFRAFAISCGISRDPALRAPCARARGMGATSAAAAKAFFERNFRTAPSRGDGVLTAYFAPEYPARRSPDAAFTAPVRRKPTGAVMAGYAPPSPTYSAPAAAPAPAANATPDVIGRVLDGLDPDAALEAAASAQAVTPQPYTPPPPPPPPPVSTGWINLASADRAVIETSPAPDALAWMRPEDLFFLQIQGSGTLVFADGARAKVTYAGDNGRPFVAIARPMVERGLLGAGRASGDNIRAWLASHAGAQADAVMRLNPRYVFFALAPDDGRDPAGAAGVPLPAGRSLAVDPGRHGYGDLYWIDASAPVLAGAHKQYRRLAMSLDTGAAIRGEVRADLYIGRGDAAGVEAGRVRHTLTMVRLIPVPDVD